MTRAVPRLMRPGTALASAVLLGVLQACASRGPPIATERYRLAESGADWKVSGTDPVLDDLRPRYADYFARVFAGEASADLDLRPLRDDLERAPVDRRNYDALNAVAIGYFELNAQAERLRGSGRPAYLGSSMRVAGLVAVPWRAYREIEDTALRDAILDFFADAARGQKPGSRRTNSRLASIVLSLAKHEPDPGRLARIHALTERLGTRP